jgi:hypothetical protein
VTLIAAFRCYEGAVLCADTKETVEGFQTPVRKLVAEECGEYWLAIAGAGNSDLIDGFIYALQLEMSTWNGAHSDMVIGALVKDVLVEYYKNEVKYYPSDSSDEKRSNFIVCVKPKQRIGLSIWELRGTSLKPAGDYALMGIGATLYTHELRKLYNTNNAIQDGKTTNRFGRIPALLLGIHLFSLAKGTSTYIGGDTEAVFVFDDREMQPVPLQDIEILESRVNTFDQIIAEIVLKCPDTTIQDVEVAAYLENFSATVLGLRRSFTENAARAIAKRVWRQPDTPIDHELHLPKDSTVSIDTESGDVRVHPKGSKKVFKVKTKRKTK